MAGRILDIADCPARLNTRNSLLVVARPGVDEITLPLNDLGAVCLGHRQISVTKPALAALAQAGVPLIICDDAFLPVALSLPLTGFHAPARRLLAQAAAKKPVRNRLWRQIVRAKIRQQAALLTAIRGDDFGLNSMAAAVQSADRGNIEAQAARRYWPALLGDEFRRRFDQPDQNKFLNYGYAVLRAIMARAVCASGLHPGLGLHHHHRENPFGLVDDLIEPLRPFVDERVFHLVGQFGPDAPLDRATKPMILEITTQRYDAEGEQRTLFDIAARISASLAAVFEGQASRMWLPDA